VADAPPSPPLLLASTSPQRKAILEQLHIPFDVVAPRYEEETPAGGDALQVVREHARGKARSVADIAEDRPIVGVDTAVVLDGRIFGKPKNASDAEQMLEELSGKTHVVVSGLCLLIPGWEDVEHEATQVAFRELTPRELGTYVASGEWEGRAGAYAIQGRGASLVRFIEATT
jgi:septum formation protein